MNAVQNIEPWLELIRRRVAGMQFGSVQIIIHEGRVTQVESTEKMRLPSENLNREPNIREVRR